MHNVSFGEHGLQTVGNEVAVGPVTNLLPGFLRRHSLLFEEAFAVAIIPGLLDLTVYRRLHILLAQLLRNELRQSLGLFRCLHLDMVVQLMGKGVQHQTFGMVADIEVQIDVAVLFHIHTVVRLLDSACAVCVDVLSVGIHVRLVDV